MSKSSREKLQLENILHFKENIDLISYFSSPLEFQWQREREAEELSFHSVFSPIFIHYLYSSYETTENGYCECEDGGHLQKKGGKKKRRNMGLQTGY